MLRILTDDEVIAKYGDISKFMGSDALPTSSWSMSILDTFELPKPLNVSGGSVAKRISCHKLVRPELESVFKNIAKYPAAWGSIDDYGGCYNFRRNKNNPRVLSRHSWAIAIDLDVADNPNGSKGNMHPLVIQAFYDAGWIWGGWFQHGIDPMHFERGVSL